MIRVSQRVRGGATHDLLDRYLLHKSSISSSGSNSLSRYASMNNNIRTMVVGNGNMLMNTNRSFSTNAMGYHTNKRISLSSKSHMKPIGPARLFHQGRPSLNNNSDPEKDDLDKRIDNLFVDFKEIIDNSPQEDRITKLADLYEKYGIKDLDDPIVFKMVQHILKTDLRFDSKLLLTQIFQESVLTYVTARRSKEDGEPLEFGEKNQSENAKSEESKSSSGSKSKKPPSPEANMKVFTLRLNESFLLILASVLLMYYVSPSTTDREITWQEFRTSMLDKNFVEKLTVINRSYVYVTLNQSGKNHSGSDNVDYYFTIGSVDNFEHKLLKANEENGIAEEFRIPVVYTSAVSPFKVIFQFLPTVLMLYGLYWITKKTAKSAGGLGGGLFGSGKSKAKKFNLEKDVKIKFDDVAGCDEAKEEIMEFVKFLQNPKKYEKLGAKIPRGAILSGSPGTGKTLLAKATAGEAGVPFYSVSGSEFVEMFVGVGASRVRDLFKTAREDAPSIVFIDEIDAIGKSRSKRTIGGNDERENTLNQLLVEMDGFSTSDHVVILAGTNRPDVLDQALMRPGRFDRKISIDNPELEGRKQIFAVHLRKIKLDPSRNLEDLKGRLAALTPGFSGADIANCCNESALIAARNNADFVSLKHFEQAIERVIAGLEKKTRVLSPEEKKIVAYHEAGHAICGWFLKHADPLLKVSIIPRGSAALGYAQYLPPDIYLYSMDRLMDRMTMTLGGRVSEELNFQSVTSGGSDDFEKVTAIAQRMVIECGMSPKVGFINYNQDRGNDMTKPYSDKTAEVIDEEIHRIVNECYERCTNLLTEKTAEVKLVAEELLNKEFITREDMIRLLGKRPFPNQNDAFDKYLEDKQLIDKERTEDMQ